MSGGDPVAMRSMTREIVRCDAELRKLREVRDQATCPDDYATACEDIDTWLERRLALMNGTARGGHRA